MRMFKVLGAALVVLAFTAIGTATASAAEKAWFILPGAAGETFGGESAKSTLQETKAEGGKGAAITCKKSEALLKESELLNTTEALTQIHFTGCTVAGLAANSLGDTSGIILAHVEVKTCLIKKGAKPSENQYGLVFTPLPVHIEVPSTALLIIVEGSFIGELKAAEAEPTTKYTLVIAQKEGAQGIEKCEGGAARTLLANTDGNGLKKAGEEAKEGILTFDKTAQSLME